MIGNPDQLGGAVERQGPEQQRVDDAEDGGAGAKAEAGDQDGEDRKAGVAAKGTDGIAEVPEERGHAALTAGMAPGLVV